VDRLVAARAAAPTAAGVEFVARSGTDTTDDAGGSATVTVSVNQTTGVRTAAVSGASAGVSTQVDLPTDAGENVSLDGLDVTPLVDGDFTLNVSAARDGTPARAGGRARAGRRRSRT